MKKTFAMTMKKTSIFFSALLLVLSFAETTSANGYSKSSSKMRLTLEAPAASYVRKRRRDGITTFDYKNRSGLLTTTQWPLIMRLESGSALSFVKEFLKGQNREALVLRDPDGCLVLTSLIDDIAGLGKTEFDANCTGLAEDEIYLEVQSEKFDTFELLDNTNTGNDAIQARLTDNDCSNPAENTQCGLSPHGKRQTTTWLVRKRGEQISDGYGFGADDDASGMVVMIDVGGARVFDPITFDRNPYVLRNMAGLINTVSEELLTGWRKTAITMTTHTLTGYVDPIAIFDFSISDPKYAGYNALVRIDSGPIIPFNYGSDFPLNDDNSKSTFNPFYDEILEQIYPTKVTVRAVAVAGEAPDFIDDINYDGKFTAADVELAGYSLISNEIKTTIRLTHDNLLAETPNPKCPPRTVLYLDLDGDMVSGAPQKKCKGTSSSTRKRRVPR